MNTQFSRPWDLSFPDKDTEMVYIQSKKTLQVHTLRILMIGEIIYIISNWIANPRDKKSNAEFYTFKIVSILTVLAIHLIVRKSTRLLETLLCILYIQIFFFYSESKVRSERYSEDSSPFINGMFIEGLFLTSIISKIAWVKAGSIICVGSFLWAFRYLEFDDNFKVKFYPLITIFLNSFILSVSAYLYERNERKNFHQKKCSELSLSFFKELIQEFLPNPVLISVGEEIAFMNKNAYSKFECTNIDGMKECFKNIKVQLDPVVEFPVYRESFQIKKDENKILTGNSKNLRGEMFFEFQHILNGDQDDYSLLNFLTSTCRYLSDNKIFHMYLKGEFTSISGETIYFDINAKKIVWDGKYMMMVIFYENVMIQKLKLLEQQSIYKDTVLATVSHDLRTPLNGIINMLSTSIEMIAEKNLRKNLEVALHSSQYLNFLINDILDYHQISNGRLRLNFERFSLPKLIEEVSKLIKFQAKMKGLKFSIECKDLSLYSREIMSDSLRLKQVILNLLGNALKFTRQGSITLSFEEISEGMNVYEKENCENIEPSHFLIKITDTGIGIKQEDQAKLFKFFGKIEDKNGKDLNKGGIGLGLAISQNIIQMLNNFKDNFEIKVESEVGKGSCFYFPVISRLDYTNDDLKSSRYLSSSRRIYQSESFRLKEKLDCFSTQTIETRTSPTREVNILIVDDDQVNIIVATSFLKLNPLCKIDFAYNGLEALEKIKSKAEKNSFYDIVLMDCNMPLMDGFETTNHIRELINAKKINNLYIIACTADASQYSLDHFLKSGMNDFMEKPFSKTLFVKKVSSLLNKSMKNWLDEIPGSL